MIPVHAIQGSPEWHALRYGVLTASRVGQLLTPGGEPRMPTCYLPTQFGLDAKLRGSVQCQIMSRLRKADGPVSERDLPLFKRASADNMVRRGYIREVEPPPGTEPIASPIKLSEQRSGLMARLLHERITQSSAEEFRGSWWTEHGHEHEGAAADWFGSVTGEPLESIGFIYRDEERDCGCSPDMWRPGAFGLELKCPAGWTHIEWLMAGGVPREHVMQVQFSLWVTGLPRWYFMSYAVSPSADGPLPAWKPGTAMRPLLVEVEPEARYQDAFSEHVPTFLAEMRTAIDLLEAVA